MWLDRLLNETLTAWCVHAARRSRDEYIDRREPRDWIVLGSTARDEEVRSVTLSCAPEYCGPDPMLSDVCLLAGARSARDWPVVVLGATTWPAGCPPPLLSPKKWVLAVDALVPDPTEELAMPVKRNGLRARTEIYGARGQFRADYRVEWDRGIYGSCTNSRIEDLRAAARRWAKGGAPRYRLRRQMAMVGVPGSGWSKSKPSWSLDQTIIAWRL